MTGRMAPTEAEAARWRATQAAIPEAQRGDAEAIAVVEGFGDWHMLRQTGVGGSDVAAILGLDPHKRPIDVWREKRGLAVDEPESEPQRWGKILEPVIAGDYAQRHSVVLAGPLSTQRHPERPWHLYTVDRVVWLRSAIDRIVEIKARGWWRLREYGAAGTDEVPLPELCQTSWYMSGLDAPRADVVALFNTWDLREYRIDRDRQLEADLLERVEQWWTRHVVEGIEPEPDGSAAYKRHLATRYEGTTGDYLAPGEDELELLGQLRAIECLYKRVEAARELLKQRVAARIGDADGYDLRSIGDGKMHYKPQRGRPRESAVVAELAERLGIGPSQLEAIKRRHRGEPTRPLKLPTTWRGDELVVRSPELDAALRQLTDTRTP